ncbi:MAG: hypothetical protein AAFX05_01255 [Planctomycetota bacterium]
MTDGPVFDFDDPRNEHIDDDLACLNCGRPLRGRHPDEDCPVCRTPVRTSLEVAELVGSDTVLAESFVCLQCGYDLKGLRGSDDCPECGKSIADSLRSQSMHHQPIEYVRRLHIGAIVLLVTTCVSMFALCCGGAPMGGAPSGLVNLLVTIAAFVGWWLLTTPSPGEHELQRFGRARRVVRVSAAVSIVASACAIASVLLMLITLAPVLVAVLATGGSIVAMVAGLVMLLAGMVYLRRMAMTLGSLRIARRAQFVLIMTIVELGLWVVAIIGIFMLFVGGGVGPNQVAAGFGMGLLLFLAPALIARLITWIASIVLFASLTGALGRVIGQHTLQQREQRLRNTLEAEVSRDPDSFEQDGSDRHTPP